MSTSRRRAISIRDSPPLADTTILLHMGADNPRSLATKTENIIRAHDYWIGVLDRQGRFAVSVYALLHHADEDVILSRLPHRHYGRSNVAALDAAGVPLLPTSISILGAIPELQPLHYSAILDIEGLTEPLLGAPLEHRQSLQIAVRHKLEELLSLFSFAEKHDS